VPPNTQPQKVAAHGEPLAAGARCGRVGWGRAMRRAVANWYLDKAPLDLAFQV
jgi:hypothetical protein